VSKWFDWKEVLYAATCALVIVFVWEWDGRPTGVAGFVTGFLCCWLYQAGRRRGRDDVRQRITDLADGKR